MLNRVVNRAETKHVYYTQNYRYAILCENMHNFPVNLVGSVILGENLTYYPPKASVNLVGGAILGENLPYFPPKASGGARF